MKKIKKKALVIIAILIMLVAAVAYFLFGVYDKNETLQKELPLGLIIISIVAIAIIVFSCLDKPYQKAIKTD